MFSQSAQSLVQAAQAAIRHDPLAAGVEAIYRCADAAIAVRQPACHQCTRCCQFDRFGHNLFVSTAELALFLRRTHLSRIAGPIAGTCPFLRTAVARCSARAARPLGCRLFYCDESAMAWQQNIYDHLHRRMQHLHQGFDVPYFYADWLTVLRAATLSHLP